MAFSIYDSQGFAESRISDIYDRVWNQLDPRFTTFKRIGRIFSGYYDFENIIDNLRLAEKKSFKIDLLKIDKDHFDEIRDYYKDKWPKLMIENLKLDYDFLINIFIEDIEFIKQINPKMLTINEDIWTVENIKTLALLNFNECWFRF